MSCHPALLFKSQTFFFLACQPFDRCRSMNLPQQTDGVSKNISKNASQVVTHERFNRVQSELPWIPAKSMTGMTDFGKVANSTQQAVQNRTFSR